MDNRWVWQKSAKQILDQMEVEGAEGPEYVSSLAG